MQALKTCLVEDSPVIRANLIATPEELVPVRVIATAGDEAAVLRWLCDAAEPVDPVIVDIFLRQGSGLGVLSAAQLLPQRTRRAVLSNYASLEMRRECLALGADRVFDKSNEIDALVPCCADLAADKRAFTAAPVRA